MVVRIRKATVSDFFEGTHDQQTPMELAEWYMSHISAPHKELVRFENTSQF
jgi:hypothetical protein